VDGATVPGTTAEPAGRASSDGSAFHTAMAHLYRAEMNRMTVWRQRLDVTSNWAVVLFTALTGFALGSPGASHAVLLLGFAGLAVAIVLEARRYRHVHASQQRLLLLERGYLVSLLHGDADPGWRTALAADLERPALRIGLLLAIGVRLRRNYLLLIYLLAVVWFTKTLIHPTPAEGLGGWLAHLAITARSRRGWPRRWRWSSVPRRGGQSEAPSSSRVRPPD
jgi:uncharacterized membrane protein